jgi:hypothetical protein
LCRWGPSQFSITDNLKNWDITGIIHKIACPTLLISATLDEIQEFAVLPFFLKIPKVKGSSSRIALIRRNLKNLRG